MTRDEFIQLMDDIEHNAELLQTGGLPYSVCVENMCNAKGDLLAEYERLKDLVFLLQAEVERLSKEADDEQ